MTTTTPAPTNAGTDAGPDCLTGTTERRADAPCMTPSGGAGTRDGGTLIERARDVQLLNAWIAEATANGEVEEGVLPDYLAELVEIGDASFREKVLRAGRKALALQGEAKLIAEEVARLAARKQARERDADRLKEYIKLCLELAGEAKVADPFVTVRVQRNSAPSTACTLGQEELARLFHDEQSPVNKLVKEIPTSYALDTKAAGAAYLARRKELEAEAERTITLDTLRDEVETHYSGNFVLAADALGIDDDEATDADLLAARRQHHVTEALAREFPGITAAVGSHVRIA